MPFYEISKATMPKDIDADTQRGRTKYPFGDMRPAKPGAQSDVLEIEGEREANLALIRMRGYARTHGAQFKAEKIFGDWKTVTVHDKKTGRERTVKKRKIKAVRIFRVA
jgi:hypothetical protein